MAVVSSQRPLEPPCRQALRRLGAERRRVDERPEPSSHALDGLPVDGALRDQMAVFAQQGDIVVGIDPGSTIALMRFRLLLMSSRGALVPALGGVSRSEGHSI